MKTEHLGLGPKHDEEDHPRRFCPFPNGAIVAYGGEDGGITCLEEKEKQPKKARQFDEEIRAVAVSIDGKRVAVGFEDGSSKIFVYDDYNKDEEGHHPFLAGLKQKKRSGDDDDNEDEDEGGFFSQLSEGDHDENEVSYPGPSFEVPIRDLKFDPRNKYYLAVASESGFCVINTKSESASANRHLVHECDQEHDSGGIRGLAYCKGQEEDTNVLASLAMDGRLCLWDVSDPNLGFELLHRDVTKCVSKTDVGEINEADVADRSCRPVFSSSKYLGLPGSTDMQLRNASDWKASLFLSSVDGDGHIETIVSMVFTQDEKHVITSGRDGRIVLWKLEEKVSRENFAQSVEVIPHQ